MTTKNVTKEFQKAIDAAAQKLGEAREKYKLADKALNEALEKQVIAYRQHITNLELQTPNANDPKVYSRLAQEAERLIQPYTDRVVEAAQKKVAAAGLVTRRHNELSKLQKQYKDNKPDRK